MRELYTSNTKWEPIVGYSRAVKVDNQIFVSGTTATDEKGLIVGINNPYEQTIQIFKNIEKALNYFSASLDNIVRTRMFVINIDHWQEIGKAHGEIFQKIRPASTLVQIKGLINPDMLLEIEVDAIIY